MSDEIKNSDNQRFEKNRKILRILLTIVSIPWIIKGLIAINTQHAFLPPGKHIRTGMDIFGAQAINYGFTIILFALIPLCVWFDNKKIMLAAMIIISTFAILNVFFRIL